MRSSAGSGRSSAASSKHHIGRICPGLPHSAGRSRGHLYVRLADRRL